MATEWVDVADSAVKIGFGALSGGLFAVWLERMRYAHERRRTLEKVRSDNVIQPIVAFLDDLMAAMGEVYWSHLEREEPQIAEKMVALRQREGAIEARVAALKNEDLSAKWNQLTPKVVEVRTRISERQLGDPRAKMHEAFSLGGEILCMLFELETRDSRKSGRRR
jgi:hypothetical protein